MVVMWLDNDRVRAARNSLIWLSLVFTLAKLSSEHVPTSATEAEMEYPGGVQRGDFPSHSSMSVL